MLDFTKASPIDIATFRRDTSTKYPTFAPPASVSVSIPNEKLAESLKPIPVRPNYHSTEIPIISPPQPTPQTDTSLPLPGTPAPSPPPSPVQKPKKQQFQTDPSRPFVFPYSRIASGAPSSLVPFAIAEADKLYHRHAYVSLGLYQMYEAREECLREERGLGRSGLIGFTAGMEEDEDEAAEEAMRRDWKYEEEEQDCLARGQKEGAKAAREKRASAKRLYRVEIIYVSDGQCALLTVREAPCRSCTVVSSCFSSSCSQPSQVQAPRVPVSRAHFLQVSPRRPKKPLVSRQRVMELMCSGRERQAAHSRRSGRRTASRDHVKGHIRYPGASRQVVQSVSCVQCHILH